MASKGETVLIIRASKQLEVDTKKTKEFLPVDSDNEFFEPDILRKISVKYVFILKWSIRTKNNLFCIIKL